MNITTITPAHKKDKPSNKEDYNPASLLSLLSQFSERLLYDQLSENLEKYLQNLLCGFWKADFIQHAMFKLLQAWQKELD